MSKFRRGTWILDVGVFGASATVDMKLQESANQNLSSATDLAGTNVAITQLVAAGGNNRLVSLEARAGQMTKRYLGVLVTVGTAATLVSLIGIGGEAIDKPGNANDTGSVAQRLVTS